ncbi:hypothetical protein DAERI_190059 [Deinococcus aerius]|uniref:Uncharacterized protein n=1 Tax=Deinococcus aerius TaxID=200253 RepID=A0A2I9DAG3_9DEIO|nr:hypothetical protein DAERI_190059 [Deinococcus aerius]
MGTRNMGADISRLTARIVVGVHCPVQVLLPIREEGHDCQKQAQQNESYHAAPPITILARVVMEK